MLTANIVATLPQFPLVKREGQCRGHLKINAKIQPLTIARPGPLGICVPFCPIDERRPVVNSTRTHCARTICHSTLNARCAAEQTQTVTREAPTITHIPGKEKSPQLDDGGSGFPPRDDGDGGGGGGGGGGNWSGGFFFFGFLAFLGFLKDKESEGPYRNERRR